MMTPHPRYQRQSAPHFEDEYQFVGNLHYSPYYHAMSHQSVFDRLSSTPTRSSLSRDEEARAERSSEKKMRSPRGSHCSLSHASRKLSSPPVSPRRTPQQMNEFYQRIYKQDTISSAAHHHEKLPTAATSANCSNDADTTPIKLFIQHKTTTEVDLSLYPVVRKSIANYWQDKLSGKSVALDILEVFWKRDYKAIDRVGWEVYPGCAEGDGAVWFVEKKAIKDYKGSYGSVTAKCKVKFVKSEGVFAQDYTFVKSGAV